MANTTTNATGPKTPPPGHDPEIKSTPNTRGTAVMSEHVPTVGTGSVNFTFPQAYHGLNRNLHCGSSIDDMRPWVRRDVEENSQCTINEMLQELLYCCSDDPTSETKEELFKRVHEYVFGLCDDAMKDAMQKYLTKFAEKESESSSYEPFVQAANHALLRLSQEKIPGIISPNRDDDDNKTLLHHNNMPMTQEHHGVKSTRKPDVVVVSCETAMEAMEGETKGRKEPERTKPSIQELFSNIASKQPKGRFKWTDVLSIFEFKRTRKIASPNYEELEIVDTPPTLYMKYGKPGDIPPNPTSSMPSTVPTHRTSNEATHSMQLRSSTGERKRPSDHQGPNESSSKRVKISSDRPDNEKGTKTVDPIEQNGLYAAEMFAAHVARQHVLSCLVNNDMIYIWHFDRQDAIQSSGFSFIKDLPRFLILLLIMQRLPYADWGHNLLFGPKGEFPKNVEVKDEMGIVDLEIDFHSKERTTHFGLRGRATNVFPVKSKELSRRALKLPSRNKTQDLVAKLYWPEESRESEEEILKKVHEIAAEHPEVKDHVPDVIWAHKFEETSTAKIRGALGIDNAQWGSRALYIIVFRKLRPITELSGDQFLRAWWHAVNCHRILWKCGVLHRDISPSNLMYYLDSSGEVVGVLNDYDLSSIKVVPSGRERTGTVPFMALDLLTDDAIKGRVEHLYQHDAESFIWVLTWVCLRYEHGKLLTDGRPLDAWLTVDARACHEKKSSFLNDARHKVHPSSSHASNWPVAQSCLDVVSLLYARLRPTLEVMQVFNTWFDGIVPSRVKSL